MEQSRVTIVGAGPAGLVLALSLSQQGISSIILEKETEVNRDPRGVYLAGDAIRIVWSLGLGQDMHKIGHAPDHVHFHSTSFANTPYYSIESSGDGLQQSVPTGIFMIQPELETALRERVTASDLCSLRTACAVQQIRQADDVVEIQYIDPDKTPRRLQTSWLIGADGKRGVVRKTFLEPVASIRQIETDYKYEGTWVAANLKISLPTPETHPDFPAWQLGMTPHEVYDLFWPPGWHFCSPPGKPTASGRFGPVESRFYRHEFKQEDFDDKTMDAEELLWEHLTPMITRTRNAQERRFGKAVTFPRDCVETSRCRPFTFAHKVVNKWHYKKSILIGDAAHVFPPFGGQGIASGIRDAHQLAWRIATLEKQPQHSDGLCETMLDAWAAERTRGIKEAATFTKMNGMLCNNRKPLIFPLLMALEWLTQNILGTLSFNDAQAKAEQRGFQGVQGGFFLNDHEGGCKLPQIYVDTFSERKTLSDTIFDAKDSSLRLLVLQQGSRTPGTEIEKIRHMVSCAGIPREVLSPDSIVSMSTIPCSPASISSSDTPGLRKVSPTPLKDLTHGQARAGYDITAFQSRLGRDTRYAIVRPDFYVFATAKDPAELRICFEKLKKMLGKSEKFKSVL